MSILNLNFEGIWLRFHILNLSIAVCTMFAALTFNKLYLERKFSRVLIMERDFPKNLISFGYIIKSSIVFVLDTLIVIFFQLYEDQQLPAGCCSYIIFISIIMGCFGFKLKIRNFFFHYLQQMYHSSPLFQWLIRKTQRGRIMPTLSDPCIAVIE